jgi:hypothetical protein
MHLRDQRDKPELEHRELRVRWVSMHMLDGEVLRRCIVRLRGLRQKLRELHGHPHKVHLVRVPTDPVQQYLNLWYRYARDKRELLMRRRVGSRW